jgi:hypothetical protein
MLGCAVECIMVGIFCVICVRVHGAVGRVL